MTTDVKKTDPKIEPKDTKAGKDAEGTNKALQETRAAQLRRDPTAPKPDPNVAPGAHGPASAAEPELTAEEKKAKAEDTKVEHDAIEKAATINTNLAKDGSANRVDVAMRAGKAHWRWGQFVPTRELTDDELEAVDNLGGTAKVQSASERDASRRDPQPTTRRVSSA